MYSIGEMSKLTGLSIHALRYYEKEEIIFPIKNKRGLRQYNENDLKWIRFVIKLRSSQMPVAKIKEYTSLFKQGDDTIYKRLSLLESHYSGIIAKIEELENVKSELETKISNYKSLILNKSLD